MDNDKKTIRRLLVQQGLLIDILNNYVDSELSKMGFEPGSVALGHVQAETQELMSLLAWETEMALEGLVDAVEGGGEVSEALSLAKRVLAKTKSKDGAG